MILLAIARDQIQYPQDENKGGQNNMSNSIRIKSLTSPRWIN
jgi:hypothetical protein